MSGDYTVGKGRPPLHSQFQPGQTGNGKGRPKGKQKVLPYEKVLGQTVTVLRDGISSQMRADEAFILATMEMSLGNSAAVAKVVLAALAKHRMRDRSKLPGREVIMRCYSEPGEPNFALRDLGIATLLDPYRGNARMMLEPWIVERQLEMRGDDPLSVNDQQVVYAATRSPRKVKWPSWWCTASI